MGRNPSLWSFKRASRVVGTKSSKGKQRTDLRRAEGGRDDERATKRRGRSALVVRPATL